MKQISEEELRKIGHLAAIALSDEELREAGKMLDSLLSGFDILTELDTDGAESSGQMFFASDAVREDEEAENEKNEWNRERAIKNAPDFSDGFFIVPETIQ